jgi:hypothetical protein
MPSLGEAFFSGVTLAPRVFFLGVQRRLEPALAGGRFEDRGCRAEPKPVIAVGKIEPGSSTARTGQNRPGRFEAPDGRRNGDRR